MKRRRERDRPKAANDALYHPNKRVLLSYESDEDDDEERAADGMETKPVVDFLMDHPNEETSTIQEGMTVEDPPEEEGRVFRTDGAGWVNGPEHKNESALWSRGTHRNDRTGQWAAIGSLSYQYEDYEEDEEFDSEEEEAMAYLRAVRSERQAMPEFFSAQNAHSHSELHDLSINDTRGYLEDGTYVAAPVIGPVQPEKTVVEPQEAFTSALKARFLEQRRQLHVEPSSFSLARLDEKHPTALPINSNKGYANWHRALRNTAPQPTQLRAMDQITVIRVMELMQKHYLCREQLIATNASAWIWSLLARLDDVGIMDNERISIVRDFGKRAILVQLSFQNPEAAAQLEEVSAAESGIEAPKKSAKDGNENTDEGTSSSAPSTKEGKAGSILSRTNTLATLDMIIVLVGEVFGQRDLLEFREPWAAESEEEVEQVIAGDAESGQSPS